MKNIDSNILKAVDRLTPEKVIEYKYGVYNCPVCYSRIKNTWKYCGYCGKRVYKVKEW